MVIHKDPASWIMFCLLRNQITCHSVKGRRISFPSARSPSRQGSGLGSTRKRVAIYWHLDLRVLRVGLWVNSCCCWMGSVWRDKAQERERVQPCNVCEKAFKFCQRLNRPKFGRKVAIFLSARVVTRSSRSTKISTYTRSLWVASLTTGRAFATSSCQALWDHPQFEHQGGFWFWYILFSQGHIKYKYWFT